MICGSHGIVPARIGEQAGFLKLREAMGEESGEIACIDQVTAHITGQPLEIHSGVNSVVGMEPVSGAGRRITKDVIRRCEAKWMRVISGCGRRICTEIAVISHRMPVDMSETEQNYMYHRTG